MILQKLKADAESYLGEKVTEAVITVPAYFNDAQRQATKDAGKIAGLDVKRIINEPTAAALYFAHSCQMESGRVLVYDLGGGTFDASIVEISGRMANVVATGGIRKLGGHFFDDDALTDQPEKVLAAEMIREKLLHKLSDEIPHGIAVSIEKMREREDKPILDIEATIYCERESHKGIVIGKKGAMLKDISTNARHELEQFFECKINLQCWVKVKEDWRNREGLIHNFGLD